MNLDDVLLGSLDEQRAVEEEEIELVRGATAALGSRDTPTFAARLGYLLMHREGDTPKWLRAALEISLVSCERISPSATP